MTITDHSRPDSPPASHMLAVDTAREAADPQVPAYEATRAEVAAEGGMSVGWYPDPADQSVQRYWDGDGWVGAPVPVGVAPPATPDAEPVEAELPAGTVTVPLRDTVVHILPRDRWPSSGLSALREGDFAGWAEKCLATDDDLDAWEDLDPTLGEVEEMFGVYADLTGQSAGKSRTSNRSSRGGRRR